jgi:predicted methyltransferase
MQERELRGAVALCHYLLRQRLKAGDHAIDATCGNGKDTLLLAQLVGPAGRVWAFDIQAEAIARTSLLLAAAGCATQVSIRAAGHEHLGEWVSEPVQAVVFNLGYLPGGARQVTTLPDSTVAALGQAAALLAPGGTILVAIYTGHGGGSEEEAAVLAWAAALDPLAFHVWSLRQLNRPAATPYLLMVERGRPGRSKG